MTAPTGCSDGGARPRPSGESAEGAASGGGTRASTPVTAEDVDAVMAAARVLVGVVAASVAQVDDTVTAPQLRILVLTASRGPWNMAAVAEALGVHPSNATRAVDRLVSAGLLLRRESPVDRRQVELTLSPSGKALVGAVLEHRRRALERVLANMPGQQRHDLVPALLAFAEAAGEPPSGGVWPDLTGPGYVRQ
jgi:DNA-binding MarR family transcriptional regulator